MSKTIDFYFDFAPPYGFIAATQIDEIAAQADRTVTWRPFLLGSVYKKYGQSPLDHSAKRDYVNKRDVFRVGRMRGLEIRTPRGWPEHSLPAGRLFYWIEQSDPVKAADYARAAYRAYWIDGLSTADPGTAVDVAERMGLNPEQAAAAIQDQAIKARFAQENDTAIERGVFSSPFIFVDGEPF